MLMECSIESCYHVVNFFKQFVIFFIFWRIFENVYLGTCIFVPLYTMLLNSRRDTASQSRRDLGKRASVICYKAMAKGTWLRSQFSFCRTKVKCLNMYNNKFEMK